MIIQKPLDNSESVKVNTNVIATVAEIKIDKVEENTDVIATVAEIKIDKVEENTIISEKSNHKYISGLNTSSIQAPDLDKIYEVYSFKEELNQIPEDIFYEYRLLSTTQFTQLSQLFLSDYAYKSGLDVYGEWHISLNKYSENTELNCYLQHNYLSEYFKIYNCDEFYFLVSVNFEMLYNLKENKLSDIINSDIQKILGKHNLNYLKIITLNIRNVNEYEVELIKDYAK